MDRTESTVRNLLTAIEAPLYDVGVLSDRGMLPGLDSISAAAVLERLPLLKYRNVHGSHIYIRPSGEHRFTTLDDLSETSLARLAVDGFNPCAVVETSAGNFQAWLKHSRMFPKLLGTYDLLKTADGLGYFGYRQNHRTYIEVLSSDKVISDSQKRNAKLFEQLGIL